MTTEWLTGCPECGMDGGCGCDSETWNPPAQQEEKPTTREEILSMAREAGFYDGEIGRAEDAFQRFAALVAAHVRETERKPWVGLTDEEKQTAIWSEGGFGAGALWAEAKLREKNA